VYVPENGIAFPPSNERYDIKTFHYSLDDLSLKSNIYDNKDFRHHIAARTMNEHDRKHFALCFKYGKECRGPFQDDVVIMQNLKRIMSTKENAHCGDL
jgi:hypothetical protein